jgi:hypothetical protein
MRGWPAQTRPTRAAVLSTRDAERAHVDGEEEAGRSWAHSAVDDAHLDLKKQPRLAGRARVVKRHVAVERRRHECELGDHAWNKGSSERAQCGKGPTFGWRSCLDAAADVLLVGRAELLG